MGRGNRRHYHLRLDLGRPAAHTLQSSRLCSGPGLPDRRRPGNAVHRAGVLWSGHPDGDPPNPALLGPSPAQQLQRRVEDIAESRADLVEAADAERRRIERDLHDGTQQRLVSLAVNLGLAKAALTDVPDKARKVIEEAHREAKEAIAELNHLVRGLHPAVLEDRGLDAALSGVAARVPCPVRLRMTSTTVRRPPWSRSRISSYPRR